MKSYKFEVFTNEIEQNILAGYWKPGRKLPSVRELKQQYPLSISSIQRGYDHLMMLGLVESIAKSGYYVAKRPDTDSKIAGARHNPIIRDSMFEQHLELTISKEKRGISEFNVAAPGDLLVPQKLLLRTLQHTIREHGAGLLRYYPPNGSEELRGRIISRAAAHKALINSDELLITDGALQALYIALTSVCVAGDVVAVESPCVFSVLEAIRVLGLKVVEIPVHHQNGFDVDFLRVACHTSRIRAIVVTPNFHNPTGILLSDEQKASIASVAREFHVPVIENDIYGDLHLHGARPSSIRSYDNSGLVMTYSSYSKTLAPGMRIGWLAAGKFTLRAEQVRFALGRTVSPLFQETVNRLLSEHSYDRHLRSLRMQLARNAYQTIELISAHFPEGTDILRPSGGYSAWVRMPYGTDMRYFYNQCEQIGVRFTPGHTFSFSGAYEQYFRVVFADRFSAARIAAIKMAGRRAHPNLY